MTVSPTLPTPFPRPRRYWDAVVNNSRGGATRIKRAVCMKEEDGGMLWKHLEYRNGELMPPHKGRPSRSFPSHQAGPPTSWPAHPCFPAGHTEVRRARKLTISFIATIANYE